MEIVNCAFIGSDCTSFVLADSTVTGAVSLSPSMAGGSMLLVGSSFEKGLTFAGSVTGGAVVELRGCDVRQTSNDATLFTVGGAFTGTGGTLVVRDSNMRSAGAGVCVYVSTSTANMVSMRFSLISNTLQSTTGTPVQFAAAIGSSQYVEVWGNTLPHGSLSIPVTAALRTCLT